MPRIFKAQLRKAVMNRAIRGWVCGSTILLVTGLLAVAQETAANNATSNALIAAVSASSPVPRLVRFAGVAKDTENKPLTGVTGITFLLYKDQEGGAPLWMETQNVQPDSSGRYSIQLGATKPDGLPTDVFTSGEARWLAVQISGQSEQPRVLLLSVPYALKAADAETIGGLPPSAFVLAASSTSANGYSSNLQAGNGNSAPASGEAFNRGEKPGPQTKTTNYVAKFTSTKGALGNSLLFDNGTDVGVSTSTPAFPLDVNGVVNAASYNLAGKAFAFGSYANQNVFLGFSGNSAITGENNTGTGIGALSSTNTGAENTALGAWALFADTTGDANTATGWLTLSKNTTGIQNTAAGVQAMENNTSGTNNTADGVFSLFENTTGNFNTAIGSATLNQNTGGIANTAIGNIALNLNTTGSYNTGAGNQALFNNLTGSANTALGAGAGPDSASPNLSNATAIGADAIVSENNALTLGCIAGTNSCPGGVDVGIGENMPSGPLHITGPAAAPPSSLLSAHNGLLLGTNGTSSYKWIQTYGGPLAINPAGNDVGIGTATPTALLSVSGADSSLNGQGAAIELSNSASGGGSFYLRTGATGTYTPAGGFSIANNNLYVMSILSDGDIGIQTNSPTHVFEIAQGSGVAYADGWMNWSSRRWKTNIQTLHGALEKVQQLRGVSYDLKANGKHEVGVIAEEVGAVVPEVVTWDKNGKDAEGVDYSRLTALLIEATKEQQKEFRQQQAELTKALHQVKQQQSQLRAQNAAMRGLEAQVLDARETLRQVKAQVAAAQTLAVAAK